MPVEPNPVYLMPPKKEMIIRGRRLLLSDKDPRHGLTLPIDVFFRSLAQDVGDARSRSCCRAAAATARAAFAKSARPAGWCSARAPRARSSTACRSARCAPVSSIGCCSPEDIAAAIGDARARRAGAPLRSTPSPPQPTPGSTPSPAAARRVRHRLLALQDEHGHAAHRAAAGAQPFDRPRRVRRAAAQRSARAERALPGPADRRDPVLPRRRGVRGARAAGHPRDGRSLDAGRRRRSDARLGGGLRDRAGGLLARDAVSRAADRRSAAGQPQDPRHRRAQGVARGRQRRHLYGEEQVAGSAASGSSGTSRATERLSGLADAAPDDRVRAAQRDPRRAVHEAGPHHLPQHADLPAAARAADGADAVPLRAEAGRHPVPRAEREPGGLLDEFETIDEHAKIYRKRRDIGLPRDLKLPLPRAGAGPGAGGDTGPRRAGRAAQLLATYDSLLDRFMPPSLLVDERGQLVDSFGGAESLLRVKSRRPSQMLLDMLDDELRTRGRRRRSARVQRDAEPVRFTPVPFPASAIGAIVLRAEPVRDRARHADARAGFAVQEPFDTMHASAGGAGACGQRRGRPRRRRRRSTSTASRATSMHDARGRALAHQGEPAGGN